MADDDGFILNFATAETSAPVVRTTKAKNGGRWKDRLHERRVKKHQATKEQKKLRQSKAGSDPSQHQQHRQEQKTQQDDEVARLLDEISGHHPSKQKQKASSAAGSSGPTALTGQAGKQIVSSLFTKNPEIPVLPSNAGQDKSVSSNAVVDTSTFEGLGLDPDIVKFLHTKLEISKPTAIQQNALPTLIGKEVVGGCDEAFDVERDGQTEHDAFVQAATGSGKTLAYLLPIIHRLLTASTMPTKGAYPSRELGTFAIILTPTRELAQQVYETVQTLVNMPLDKSTGMRAHWMVPGIVVGGEKKQSEKGRLRKGVTILACTPGRLLDHLENTKAFMVDNLRWLVLDEADRLLELGFEETLSKILALLDEKLKFRVPVLGRATMVNSPLLPRRRINVLCSATLQDNVKRLATQSLSNPRFISATRVHENADQAAAEAQGHRGKQSASSAGDEDLLDSEGRIKFTVPDQLVQRAVIVPAKLRLVTLVAQIKNTFRRQPSSKLIVFLSCKDAVDFMYFLMAHGGRQAEAEDDQDDVTRDLFSDAMRDSGDEDSGEAEKQREKKALDKAGPRLKDDEIVLDSTVFPGAKLFRLHGSMLQKRRTETFLAFSKSTQASILFTTDVAARGLDLPNVNSIIQFDPPSDVSSYLHRVGRTARLGRVGEAILFLLPSESGYIQLLQDKGLRPQDESMESVLKLTAKHEGVNKASEWQLRAGEIQAMLERFTLGNMAAAGLAKQAYLSSIRAYATHISAERNIFHVKFLHFGHLAKAFALRETPKEVASGKGNNQRAVEAKEKKEHEVAVKKRPLFKRGNDISEFAVGDISAYYGPRVKRSKD